MPKACTRLHMECYALKHCGAKVLSPSRGVEFSEYDFRDHRPLGFSLLTTAQRRLSDPRWAIARTSQRFARAVHTCTAVKAYEVMKPSVECIVENMTTTRQWRKSKSCSCIGKLIVCNACVSLSAANGPLREKQSDAVHCRAIGPLTH